MKRSCGASLSILSSLLIGLAHAQPPTLDATLLFDQKFKGIISSTGDVDLVAFDEVKDSKFTASVLRDGKGPLVLDLALLDSSLNPIDVGTAKKPLASGVTIDDFVIPQSGTFVLRVSSANGELGKYKLSIHGKPVKKPKIPDGAIASSGEIDSIVFDARGDSRLSGTIEKKGGALDPLLVEIVAPDSTLLPIADGSKVKDGKTAITFVGLALPALGEYQIRVTGKGGTIGGYESALVIDPPKKEKGTLFEDEYPDGGGAKHITLKEVYFGRGLRTETGSLHVVSPFTTIATDPLTNEPIEGSLEPLFPGASTSSAVPFGLDELIAPAIVPRNGVLVLRFDRNVAVDSLHLDSQSRLTANSPIQIEVAGDVPPLEARIDDFDATRVFLNPVVDSRVGFTASPLVIGANGEGTAAPDGIGSIAITKGPNGLKAADGSDYEPRDDLLGSPDSGGKAIGFNPGNSVLDFVAQVTSDGSKASYGGFLPDEHSPRIVRFVKQTGSYSPNFSTPALGDSQGVDSFSIVLSKALDTAQNNGKGEYAGGALRLRPGAPDEETITITKHTAKALGGGLFRNEFFLKGKIKEPLKAPVPGGAPGDPYEIVRAERFEPDPDHPVDPASFDPTDPDLPSNESLANFIEIRDRNGVLEPDATAVDPLSTITIHFDEPMAIESFRPYESFYVSASPDPQNPGIVQLGRITTSDGGKAMTFESVREVQFGPSKGTFEPVGLGPAPALYQLHIRSVPSSAVLSSLLGSPGFQTFVNEGRRGVTDLAGRPLAFSLNSISAVNPVIDYNAEFGTKADPSLETFGAIVHRFRGQPKTGALANGDTGVTFDDVPASICGPGGNLYGPRIADINLFTNGFLSGAPVAYLQKIHDDFNPPPTGQLTPIPFGNSTPIGGFAVLGGAKLQHVYRAVDCSPDIESFAGTILDLMRVDFAPLGGIVGNTILPDVSIHAGHSAVVPDTKQTSGIPDFELSGLNGQPLGQSEMGGRYSVLGDPTSPLVQGSYNATLASTGVKQQRQLCLGTLQAGKSADFYDGVPIAIDNKSLFTPPASPSRAYHPLPSQGFSAPFPFNNGANDILTYPAGASFGTPFQPRNESLLLEYRVRVSDAANPPSTSNGFTFAIGILTSALPRFRIFTFGAGCTSCCDPSFCAFSCATSLGPALNGLASGGGAPLDPDRIVTAAGPDVSYPGLACICYGSPQNKLPCSPGLIDVTVASPTIDQVAYGLVPPNGQNNFGDNSRYFLAFDYVKRESLIRSPFVRVEPISVTNPVFFEPIVTPPLDHLPAGTSVTLRLRASTDGVDGFGTSNFVLPEDVATLNGAGRPYLQFELRITGNTSTQLVPTLEEIVFPFKNG